MKDSERNLRELLVRLLLGGRCYRQMFREDVYGRTLVCTPFDGNYGIAGWVVCLNGSPPRGTLLVFNDCANTLPPNVFYVAEGRSRRVHGAAQVRAVVAFWREHLCDRREAFTLSFASGQGVNP